VGYDITFFFGVSVGLFLGGLIMCVWNIPLHSYKRWKDEIIIKRIKYIINTIKHKKAFFMVEKQLLGGNTLSGYLHDIDKLFLYLLPLKINTIRKIHRKYSKHHVESIRKKNYVEMVIDWECARFTKPDKPLDAYDTLMKFYPQEKENVLPILKQLKLLWGE